jgi:hypothetical protein
MSGAAAEWKGRWSTWCAFVSAFGWITCSRPPSPLASDSGRALALLALLTLVAALAWPVWTWAGLNQDVGWLLHVAHRLFDGGTLYVDVIEVNPPLVVWLTAIPAAIERWVGVPAPQAVNVYMVLLTWLSAAGTDVLLRRTPGLSPTARRLTLGTYVFAAVLLSPPDVGQREHQLVLFLMPYLCLAVTDLRGGRIRVRWRVLVGMLAAVGLLLKPHFVVAWVIGEIVVAVRQRSLRWLLRPEVIAVVALGVLYAAAGLALAGEYLAFVRAWGSLYFDFNPAPIGSLLRLPETLASLTLLAAWYRTDASPESTLQRVCAAAAALLLGVLLIQQKGWTYHRYPVTCFVVLSHVLGLYRVWRAPGGAVAVVRLTSLAAVLTVALGRVAPAVGYAHHRAWIRTELTPAVRRHAPGGSIYGLFSGITPAFPLVNYASLRWDSRTAHGWMLRALHRRECTGRPGPAVDPRKTAAYRIVAEDLARNAPDVVLFAVNDSDAQPSCGSFRSFVIRDSSVARLLGDYRLVETSGDVEIYEHRHRMMQPEGTSGGQLSVSPAEPTERRWPSDRGSHMVGRQ